ncbi:bcl-2-modifying factor [Perognathus longimembris pacificus]|uniref:bcl-2-modifying factor n=1 Tax=Perognathus longimembris pacificus TaxID=214514 RepID=UPI002018A70C|nr:bcl-2-modifying factor [Perognathus longimembris pacificus]XP_048188774.1 bcl-2-modifying factor [Perognathus longimembris pacificus]
MEPPQCVEELEDDVFQAEDGEPGTQPGSLLSAALFAQSHLDCPLSRLQLFPLTHCCGPGLRPTSQEDKATQTLSPASPSQGVMLPCGVTEEPQRLFYGSAGYRLRLPAPARSPAAAAAAPPRAEQPPDGPWPHRAELQIARKLRCIADQFHRLHAQRHQQNPDRGWGQILLFLHNLALNRDHRDRAGPRASARNGAFVKHCRQPGWGLPRALTSGLSGQHCWKMTA